MITMPTDLSNISRQREAVKLNSCPKQLTRSQITERIAAVELGNAKEGRFFS